MSAKPVRIPGPDHPITIEKTPQRVRVTVAGKTIADSRDALTLREASYPPVQYIPRKDVDFGLLERTTNTSHCPYKGDASYYSIVPGGERVGERGVELRNAESVGRADQGARRVLSESRRRDRTARLSAPRTIWTR